jgi:hypothetical protein
VLACVTWDWDLELAVVGGEESWQKLEKLHGRIVVIDLAETRRPRDSAGRQGHGQAYLQRFSQRERGLLESCHLSEAKSASLLRGALLHILSCMLLPVPDLSPPSLSLSLSKQYILPSARLCAHVVIAPSSRSGRTHSWKYLNLERQSIATPTHDNNNNNNTNKYYCKTTTHKQQQRHSPPTADP